MKYPKVIDEYATLRLMLLGRSIARFGDGEWRCAAGGGCTSQRADPKLAKELKAVLLEQGDGFIVGIPKVEGCPRAESWAKYCAPPYLDLLAPKKGVYHSSFITRPDNAPSIDTPEYWDLVRQLWKDQNVILVVGTAKDGKGAEKKSLTAEMMHDAAQLQVIIGPRQHAYEGIDLLEKEIMWCVDQDIRAGRAQPRVILCLGTTATVLAWRLWKRGIHALDVGHIGMFMRHAGAYRYAADDLTTAGYRGQLQQLHAKQKWGADGAKHIDAVRKLVADYAPATILDYGCGEGKLSDGMRPIRVSNYDPGKAEYSKMPKPCDLVVCTDVLEHIEPEKLDAVLDHIFRLTARAAYFVIDLQPANAILPDGRNAHLSLHCAQWWIDSFEEAGWYIAAREEGKKSLTVLAEKPH